MPHAGEERAGDGRRPASALHARRRRGRPPPSHRRRPTGAPIVRPSFAGGSLRRPTADGADRSTSRRRRTSSLRRVPASSAPSDRGSSASSSEARRLLRVRPTCSPPAGTSVRTTRSCHQRPRPRSVPPPRGRSSCWGCPGRRRSASSPARRPPTPSASRSDVSACSLTPVGTSRATASSGRRESPSSRARSGMRRSTAPPGCSVSARSSIEPVAATAQGAIDVDRLRARPRLAPPGRVDRLPPGGQREHRRV